MRIKIQKIEGFKAKVKAPPSKSYTHRAFVVASLAEGRSVIKNYLRAQDTTSTLKACKAFGIKIEENEEIKIQGSGGRLKTPSRMIDCENSGTTIRLISGIAALDGEVTLTGDESVQQRPMQPLLDAINQLGVEAFSTKGDGTPPIVIRGGKMEGGKVKIRGDISSQFISSLLIVAPYARKDVKIILTAPLKSRPYIDMTLDVMEKFGVRAINEDYRGFKIEAGQRYIGRKYAIEGDYSSSSYLLALAALTKSEITIENLLKNSKQGDIAVLKILAEMGAKVRIEKQEVTVKGNRLEGIEVDLGDAPDLLPTIAALGCRARGKTVIKNVEHARYKETDRLSACATEFRKFGVKIEERRDGLIIQGAVKIAGAEVNSHNDHRMAMALSIAGLTAEGQTIVENAECVKVSFPGFYKIISSLH